MKLTEILQVITEKENLELYDNDAFIDLWSSWWSGKVADFHNYTIYNGKRRIHMERMSLNMGKKVSEDWADLLINEKTDITLSDNSSQKVLEEILKNTKFWQKANEGVEKSFALGMGAFVVNVENISTNMDGETEKDGEVKVIFCNAKKIRPITIKDGVITECAFVNIDTNKTYISAHIIGKDGNYEIHNVKAEGKDEDTLTIVEDSYYTFKTNSTTPWFSILRPNVANNININSPLGISIFANAIDILKQIDLVYDSYATEFLLGKKRVFVNAEGVTIDRHTGEPIDVFDSNDIAFYYLPESADGKLFLESDNANLRIAEHNEALQNHLNLLSSSCGLGTQHYKFEKGTITTATQVISENSELFRTKKKHEILIEQCLNDIVRAIIYAVNTFTKDTINENVDIIVKFDDSIIEDKEAQKASDRIDVASGIMSKAEFRAKWYNEDLKTAQLKINEISENQIVDDYTEPYQPTEQ